ncbi:hypothetical protein Tco_1318407 [Tanacetum coccineum]
MSNTSALFPSLPLIRESTFGFKPGTNNNQNVKTYYDAENPNPQSTQQVLLSFEENTPDEVEEIIGIPIEVEPLHEPQLEDLGLNTCNHDNLLSSREVPSFDEPKPQPQPLPNCPPLDVNLGDKRGTDPPIKPHNLDNDPKKHYGFKLGLLGQGGSLGVDLSNWEVIENNFLRGLSLPIKPIELEKGRIK